MGFLWDVTVVDSLAPCRINAGSVCNPGTAVTEAEERKNDKYKDLVVDGYLFQPLAFEIQGAAGPSTEIFLSKLCKNLSICTKEPRAGSFLKQRISLAVQIANAACVLGTINDKITFDEFFLFLTLVYYIFSCRVACSYWRNVTRIDFNWKRLQHFSSSFIIITSISRNPRILTGIRDEGTPDCNLGYYDTFELLVT